MKEIKLTQGKVTLVDDEDYEKLNKFKWHVCCGCAVRNVALKNGKQTAQIMHRVILGIDGSSVIGDHVNGNRLDNRKSNLRVATSQQNSHNQGMRCDNKSGYKGVTWNKHAKKFLSRIRFEGKLIYLGYFDDPIQASKVYDLKANELFGEFVRRR